MGKNSLDQVHCWLVLGKAWKLVPEENGRLRVRGAETAPQYVLDGVSLADN
jgi:hypothetical protein